MDEEVVEVEVIRQADDWGVASTISATTASNARHGDSASVGGGGVYFSNDDDDDLAKAAKPRACDSQQCWFILLGCFALVSPIVIALAPLHPEWGVRTNNTDGCNYECATRFVGFGTRLVLLAVAIFALFFRRARASGPAVYRLKVVALLLSVAVLTAYWVVFGLVLARKTVGEYNVVLGFATSLLDAELFVHYVTIVLTEVRRLRARYCARVTRTIDGVTRHYSLGVQSVQEAAYTILRAYYVDFPDPRAPMPYARHPLKHYKNNMAGIKFYDVDNGGDEEGVASLAGSRVRSAHRGRRRNQRVNHDERYNDEIEHQKKALRRKARLISATEEAFSVIRATRSGKMSSQEAAASIFPSMARPLQKYLRSTRQQARHTAESVVNHLAKCLQMELTARAFLHRYFNPRTCLELEVEKDKEGGGGRPLAWRLICDSSGNKSLERDLVFRLQNSEATLVVEVLDLPELRLVGCSEPAKGFVLKVNSETTV
eukprot:m.28940 g.28940  ORF g.28940 m.28940 type:complete len:487 (+) comp31109_c0_seq5:159-1619(+)